MEAIPLEPLSLSKASLFPDEPFTPKDTWSGPFKESKTIFLVPPIEPLLFTASEACSGAGFIT